MTVLLEQVTSAIGQDHGNVAPTVQRTVSDESLLAQMSQVAATRIGWPVRVVWRSRAGTTRNAPTVESVRVSEPRSL